MSKENRPRKRGPMGGGPGAMAAGEKAKDFKGTMKKLLSYLGKYKIGMIIAILFSIAGTVFSIVGPKILGKATTKIFEGLMSKISGDGAGIDFEAIGKILLALIALYVVSLIFSSIQGFIMSGVAQKVSYNLRDEISKKINRMPMKYFDTKTHGEVLSRITNDIDTLSQSLNQSLSQLITSVTLIIGVTIMMLSISVSMTVVALLVLPISLGFIGSVVKKSQKYFKDQQEFLGNVNGQVEEVFGGHNVVRVFNGEEDAIKTFNETNDKLYKSSWKSQFLSGLMMPIMTFVGNLGYVGVAILGGFLAIKDVIEVGDIQSFIQYVRTFNQPIAQLAQVANLMQSTAAAAERVFEFLEEEEEDQTVENPVKIDKLEGNVETWATSFWRQSSF